MADNQRVVVVGGGVIGLSVAWRLAGAGFAVTVVDPKPASGASWVAAGMLAPVAESWPGEDVLAIGLASRAAWPAFAAELQVELYPNGTVVGAIDAADAARLDTLAEHLATLGRAVDRLSGRELRAVEPAIGPSVRGGLLVPDDLAVDNRTLLRRLVDSARHRGVEFVSRRAGSVAAGTVRLADGSSLHCDLAVIAAGAWSFGLHPALDGLVRPVKGEILRLRAPDGVLAAGHTVRALVESRPVYLVPRADGELVLGATQYEAGFDDDVTAGGVHDLLADAQRVLPGIPEYRVTECAAGLRAGSRDNLPLIGWLEPGVLVASGHHRNGFLLAPVTADAVLALASGDRPPDAVRGTDPARHTATMTR